VLKPANYAGLKPEELPEVFKSSSDSLLMDQVAECDQCHLVYLNPRMKADVIVKSYKDAVDPTFLSQNEFRIKTFKSALQNVLNHLRITNPAGKQILDIGSAGGAFLKAAKDLGFAPVGVEPSAWLSEQGRKLYGVDLRPGTLEEQSFPEKSFDIITLWDVIEHLTDPERTMKDIHRILKDDGVLIVNYPDYGSIMCRLFGWKWPFFLNVHLYYFTRQTMARFLVSQGYEVRHMSSFWQTLSVSYVFQRAAFYLPFLKFMPGLLRRLGLGNLPMSYNMGQTLVIAHKRR